MSGNSEMFTTKNVQPRRRFSVDVCVNTNIFLYGTLDRFKGQMHEALVVLVNSQVCVC